MRSTSDNVSVPERAAHPDGQSGEASPHQINPTARSHAPARAWAEIARDMDELERKIQQSIDCYHKWLVEMCQRTAGVDADLSGGRIGRLRRRRDREFERLMRRYSSISN